MEKRKSKSNVRSRRSKRENMPKFVLCISETDGVEKGKIYRVIPDAFAGQHKLIRVVDDSDEDYLFPAANFVAVAIPKSAEKRLL